MYLNTLELTVPGDGVQQPEVIFLDVRDQYMRINHLYNLTPAYTLENLQIIVDYGSGTILDSKYGLPGQGTYSVYNIHKYEILLRRIIDRPFDSKKDDYLIWNYRDILKDYPPVIITDKFIVAGRVCSNCKTKPIEFDCLDCQKSYCSKECH